MRTGSGRWTAAAWVAAGALATAASLPAVWWEPLHADETATLRFAPGGLRAIVDDVFLDRGGAPLHFFVERFTLAWPGGLEGLRLPSLLFFLAALPAAGLVAAKLAGRAESLLLPLALALAPLAVNLATFGRMYALFLASVLWSTWVALWAAEKGGRGRWALTGLLAGLLAYVHPVAPLYSPLILAAGLLHSDLPFARLARQAWPAVVALPLALIPYFLFALGVLSERYEIELGAPRAQTQRLIGRSIPEQSLYALGPGGLAGAIFFSLLALVGLAWFFRRRSRVAVTLVLWVLVPVAFFTLVPTGTTFFFNRYLVPALPAFLLLVVAGCLALGYLSRTALVAALFLGAVLGWQAFDDVARLDRLQSLELRQLVDTVAGRSEGGILFASAGSRPFPDGPAHLLDEYLRLELPELEQVDERRPIFVRKFMTEPRGPLIGLWPFGGPPSHVTAALSRFAEIDGVVATRISPHVLVVRSQRPHDPSGLVERAYLLRRAWALGAEEDRRLDALIEADRRALVSAGQLG